MINEKEDKLKINNIGLGESITKIASQFLERIYHYDKRKENKIAVGDTPPPAKYAEWQDLWIDTSASLDVWNVQFIQSEHQIIYCIDFFGNRHSEDFQLKDGTPYTVEVIAEEGYNPGKPNIESGIIHSDIILYAETEATPIEYTIYIIQSDHQLIKVLVNGIYYTTDTSFIFGTSWSASIIPDPGYTAGQLNMNSGVLTEDITISATEAVINYYWIHISKYTHQKISVYVGDAVYTDDVKLPYGTEWRAVIEADEGYTAGTLNMTNGILTQDITISATEEVLKQFTIHIAQYDHQHIIVTANDATYRTDITLPYGTEWSARVEADTGYTAGMINNSGGILTEDVWLTAEESTINTYTITFPSFDNQEIIVTINGVDYKNSPIYVEYGTEWSARVEVTDDRYTPGEISIPGGVITEDVQLNASVAQPIMHTIYITYYDHQTIYVSANGTEYSSKQVPSVQLLHKTEYTVRIEADENYIAGTLSTTGGILTEDVTITATEAEANTFDVIIIQTVNQTITVIDDLGNRHSESFEINRRAPIEIQIVADNGYLAGKPTIDSVVFNGDEYYVTKDITVSAEAATKDNRIHFFIENRPDQTITVTYKGTIYSNGNDFYANPGETFDTKVTALILGFTAGDCEFAPSYQVPDSPSVIWITAEAPYTKDFIDIYVEGELPDIYTDYQIAVRAPGEYNYRYYSKAVNPITVRRGSVLNLSTSETKGIVKSSRYATTNTLFTIGATSYVACEDTHLYFRNPILVRDGNAELADYSGLYYPSHYSDYKSITYSVITNYLLEGDTSGVRSKRSFSGAEAFDIDKLDGAIIERHCLTNPDAYGTGEFDSIYQYLQLYSDRDNYLYNDESPSTTNRGTSTNNFKQVTVRAVNDDPNQWIGLSTLTEITDEIMMSYDAYRNTFSESITVPIYTNILAVVFPNDGYKAGTPYGDHVYGHMVCCVENNMEVRASAATPVSGNEDRNYFGIIDIGATANSNPVTVTMSSDMDSNVSLYLYDYSDSTHYDSDTLRVGDTSNSAEQDGYRFYTSSENTGSTSAALMNGSLYIDRLSNSVNNFRFKQAKFPETGGTRAHTSVLKFQTDSDGGTGFVFCALDSGYFSNIGSTIIQQILYSTLSSDINDINYPVRVGAEYKAYAYPKQNVITVGTCDQPSGTMPEGGLTLTVTGSVVNGYNTIFYGDIYDSFGDKVLVQYKTPDSSQWVTADSSETKIDLPIRTRYRIHKNTTEPIYAYIFANWLWINFDDEQILGPISGDDYDSYRSNSGNILLRCEKNNTKHAITVEVYDSKNPEFTLRGDSYNMASGESNTFTTQNITALNQENRGGHSFSYNSANVLPYVSYRLNNSNSVNSGRYSLNYTGNIYVSPYEDNTKVTLYAYDNRTYTIVDASNADTPDFAIQCDTENSRMYGWAKSSSVHADFGECSIEDPKYRDLLNGHEVNYPIKCIVFDVAAGEIKVELEKAGTLTPITDHNPNMTIRMFGALYGMTRYNGFVGTNAPCTFYLVASSIEETSNSYIIHYADKQAVNILNALSTLRSYTTTNSIWTFDIKFTRSDIRYRSLTLGYYADNNYDYAGYWAENAIKAPISTPMGSISSDIIHGKSTNDEVELKLKALIYCKGKNGNSNKVIIEVENLTDPTLRYIDNSIGVSSYIMTEAMSRYIYQFISQTYILSIIPHYNATSGTTALVQINSRGTRYTDFEKNFVSGQHQWAEVSDNTFMTQYLVDAIKYSEPRMQNASIFHSVYVIL